MFERSAPSTIDSTEDYSLENLSNIFDWLDCVREKRAMYARSIICLESQVWGYYTALEIHNIREEVPSMRNHFMDWLRDQTDWSVSSGWGFALQQNIPDGEDIFENFFKFVDQYRLLRPTEVASVTLGPEHNPTGKRVKFGFDGRMERPDEIIAVNYAPTKLHHFRFRYGNRFEDGWFLKQVDGSSQTTMNNLFEWANDEFGIETSRWEKLD